MTRSHGGFPAARRGLQSSEVQTPHVVKLLPFERVSMTVMLMVLMKLLLLSSFSFSVEVLYHFGVLLWLTTMVTMVLGITFCWTTLLP